MTTTLPQNGYLFLAAPYFDTDPAVRAQRYANLVRVSGLLMARGYAVFCPASYAHPIVENLRGMPRSLGQLQTEMLRRAAALVVVEMPGYDTSGEVRQARIEAGHAYISMFRLDWHPGNPDQAVARFLDELGSPQPAPIQKPSRQSEQHQQGQPPSMAKKTAQMTEPPEQRPTKRPAPALIHVAWTDGACKGNPGPGGWAVVFEDGTELDGGLPRTTNNVMEMTAALKAMLALEPGAVLTIKTDSEYVKKGMTEWLPGWKRRGWKKADGSVVANADLWKLLDAAASDRDVSWEWVKGHAGNGLNVRADELAVEASKRF
jgi:ribonuclease HI